MGLPTLSKSWSFSVNNVQLATGNNEKTYQNLLLAIKNWLVSTGFWVVKRSSNSVSVSNSDLWSTYTNLVAGVSAPHSWIVLGNDNIKTGFQICIDISYNTVSYLTISFCQGGFDLTTGTTSARPSPLAGDVEVVLLNNTNWAYSSSDASSVWHGMVSTDGQCTRMIICNQGQPVALWLIDKPQTPASGWTNPHIMSVHASGTNATSIIVDSRTFTGAYHYARFTNGAGTVTAQHYLGCEAYSNSNSMNTQVVPNDSSGNYPLLPIGLWSNTAGARGRNGQLFDLWYGLYANPAGTSYPASGTLYQFVQFGTLVFPWKAGTAPVTG